MSQEKIGHTDFIILLINILGDNRWKYGYEISKELEKYDYKENKFDSFDIYPVLVIWKAKE